MPSQSIAQRIMGFDACDALSKYRFYSRQY